MINEVKMPTYFRDFKSIQTLRLNIRPITIDDLNDCFAITSDLRLLEKSVAVVPHKTLQECAAYVEQVIENYKQNIPDWWIIAEKETNRMIGFCGFVEYAARFERAELGYMIAFESWNKGYATEACAAVIDYGFKHMKLHRIEATVDPENSASIRVLEKLNFMREGLMKERVICNGKYRDRYMYGLVKKS